MSLIFTSLTIEDNPLKKPKKARTKISLRLKRSFFWIKKLNFNNKKTKIIFLAITGFTFFCFSAGVYFFLKISLLNHDLQQIKSHALETSLSLKDQDFSKVSFGLDKIRTDLTKSRVDWQTLGWTDKLPFVNRYYQDGINLIEAGIDLVEAGKIADDRLNSELIKTNMVSNGGTIETFIPKLLGVMPNLKNSLPDIKNKVDQATKKINQIDQKRYPKKWGRLNLQKQISDFKNTLAVINGILPEIETVFTILPQLLGNDKPKTYLILFQNDKELRSTGGFITAYALARVEKGRLVGITSNDIYNIDDQIKSKEAAPDYLQKYLRVDSLHLRDSNLSPDFVQFTKDFKKIISRSSLLPYYDGVIALDTSFVLGMLEVLGEIKTPRYQETFSTKINEKYDIPDAIFKLELYSENLLSQQNNRKDLVADLMQAMLQKSLHLSPSKWGDFFTKLENLAAEKHLLGNSNDEQTQKLLEKYNYAGRVKDFNQDYFYLNENNYSSKKANLYIKEKIDQDVAIASDGTLSKVVSVTLTNVRPNDGWLNSTYSDYMRFYVPKGSVLKNSQYLEDVETYEDLGKTVFSGRSLTQANNSRTVTIAYQLPFKLNKGDNYQLLMQKQPGVEEIETNFFINNKGLKIKDLASKSKGKNNLLRRDLQFSFAF